MDARSRGSETKDGKVSMKSYACCLLLTAALTAAPFAHAQSPEAQLIAVLKSDAPQQKKGEACIDLAKIGAKESVAPLAALLGDEKLAHMARYGLETIADPAVDEALLAALGKLKGRLLVGVIQSIGVRRDPKAVEPLSKVLGDPDGEAAAAAATALGKIGTPPAVSALKQALGKLPSAAEALVRCAEGAPTPEQSVALYDAVRAAQVSRDLKLAATRGSILARGAEGTPLLLELLRSDDPVLFGLALRVALELPGAEVTHAIAAEIGKLPADKQGRLCAIFGDRRDAAAAPALLEIARGGTAETRVSAVRALTQMGCTAVVPVLADLACADDTDLGKSALSSLAGFPGQEANAAIVALANKPDVKLRRMGIELIGKRRIAEAMPELLRLAADADQQTCEASLKVIGDMAGTNEIPALVGILLKTSSTEAAANALAAVCVRQSVLVPGAITIQKAVYGALPDGPVKDVTAQVAEVVKSGQATVEASNKNFGDPAGGKVKKLRVDYAVNGIVRSATVGENEAVLLNLGAGSTVSPAVSEPLLAAFAQAQGAPKLALLRILCSVGGPKALAVVRAAADDANAELKESALRALCEWPAAEALPDLTKLVQAAPTPKLKILALRGYIRLVPLQASAPEAKAADLKQAFVWAERDEERRLALVSLGSFPSPDTLAFVAGCLDKAGLKDEACQAAVAIAESLAEVRPEPVAEVLKTVVKVSGNEALLKRARECLGQVRKAEAEEKAATSEEGFTPVFNGKDLSGWETKGCPWWKVVDGVLTAESTAATPLATNNHLIWKGGTPGDFEFRAEFRLSKSANSGVQLRSEAVIDRDTGYQADMNGGGNYVGFIYHPKMHLIGGRGEKVTLAADGKKESQRFADSAELQKLYKMEDWNSYRIICKGPSITLYLNGVLTTQVVDLRPDTPRQGVITLQLHKGTPMKIEYRNIRIKELK